MRELEQTQTMMSVEIRIEQICASCRPIFGVGVHVFEMVRRKICWTSCCMDSILLNKQAILVGCLPVATNTGTVV